MQRLMRFAEEPFPTWGVFIDEEKQGGGPLIDIGTHALDLTLWMMNNYEPASVTGSTYRKLADQTQTGNAWGDWDPKKFTVEDSGIRLHQDEEWQRPSGFMKLPGH